VVPGSRIKPGIIIRATNSFGEEIVYMVLDSNSSCVEIFVLDVVGPWSIYKHVGGPSILSLSYYVADKEFVQAATGMFGYISYYSPLLSDGKVIA